MINQGSPEWFEQRKDRITGSRVGSILGLNPWKTKDDVMREMVREHFGVYKEFNGNVATEWGSRNEKNAIFRLELDNNIDFIETGLHVHHDHNWIAASPDGLVGDTAVVEIKCPYGLRNSKDPSKFKRPEQQMHYYAQMQLEMACTGRRECYFYQWSPYANKLYMVDFDEDWFDLNLIVLRQIYNEYLEALKKPDQYLEDKVKVINDDVISSNYIAARERYEEAKADMESAKKELVKMANGKKARIGDLLVYPVERKGAINYTKVVKDLLPDTDLDNYRGKTSTSWGIR